MSNTHVEPRRENQRTALSAHTGDNNNNNDNNNINSIERRSPSTSPVSLSLSPRLSLRSALTCCFCCIWLERTALRKREGEHCGLPFTHIYVYGCIWIGAKQIDRDSSASLSLPHLCLLVICTTTTERCTRSLTIRFLLVALSRLFPPFLLLFSSPQTVQTTVAADAERIQKYLQLSTTTIVLTTCSLAVLAFARLMFCSYWTKLDSHRNDILSSTMFWERRGKSQYPYRPYFC